MNKTEQIILVLPLPARVLSPNCPIASLRGRFMKAAATKRYRKLAKEAVEDLLLENIPWPRVVVQPVFYHTTKRTRDEDNAIGSLKAAYDGLVDARLVEDDSPEYMARERPVFKIDKVYPRVEFILTIMLEVENESLPKN